MDLEQELGPARHAAADLERDHRAVADDAVDHKLIGRGLCNHAAEILGENAVALADDERAVSSRNSPRQ
jgi:hypothetical protein